MILGKIHISCENLQEKCSSQISRWGKNDPTFGESSSQIYFIFLEEKNKNIKIGDKIKISGPKGKLEYRGLGKTSIK